MPTLDTQSYVSVPEPAPARSPWPRALILGLLAFVLVLFMVGCKHSSQEPIVNGDNNSIDPAAANMASTGSNGQPTQVLGQSSSYTPQQQSESYQQAPIERGSSGNTDYSYNNTSYDNSAEAAGEQAIDQTDQAPPPLPDYDQPPAPESDYLWTPGYWAWSPGGYYWVPGVWCPPPYYGALWTPPYWGYYGGHYRFHRGYWGPHVGFYGGINYGFGYIGIGYFGGYWRGHDFYYNRAVTNAGHVTNVYNHTVIYNNVTYNARPSDHTSYNGGRGGINVAPRPTELAAMHETHDRPIAAQTQVRQQAAGNQQQFYNQNHGRPAQAAFERPSGGPVRIAEPSAAIAAEKSRSAESQLQQRNTELQQRNVQQQQQMQQHGAELQQQRVQQQQQHNAPPAQQPQTNVQQRSLQQQQRADEMQRRNTGAPQQNAQLPQPQRAPEPLQRSPQQIQPQHNPEPQHIAPVPQSRPVPQYHAAPSAPVARPEPTPRPVAAPHTQPAPTPRPETAPRPAPTPRPETAPRPAEPPHEEGGRPH